MGVIFDMDGVLVDSNRAHLLSWKSVAEESSVEFTEKMFWDTVGMRSESIVERYWPQPLTKTEIAEIVDRKESLFLNHCGEGVFLIPGALEFIRFLCEKSLKFALGSSAPRANVDHILATFGLQNYFGARVVAGNEVQQGKPFPDIFLHAARKMEVLPSECVVIEDSMSGIVAGKRAGMRTIAFVSAGHEKEEYQGTDRVVSSFKEIENILTIDENQRISF